MFVCVWEGESIEKFGKKIRFFFQIGSRKKFQKILIQKKSTLTWSFSLVHLLFRSNSKFERNIDLGYWTRRWWLWRWKMIQDYLDHHRGKNRPWWWWISLLLWKFTFVFFCLFGVFFLGEQQQKRTQRQRKQRTAIVSSFLRKRNKTYPGQEFI